MEGKATQNPAPSPLLHLWVRGRPSLGDTPWPQLTDPCSSSPKGHLCSDLPGPGLPPSLHERNLSSSLQTATLGVLGTARGVGLCDILTGWEAAPGQVAGEGGAPCSRGDPLRPRGGWGCAPSDGPGGRPPQTPLLEASALRGRGKLEGGLHTATPRRRSLHPWALQRISICFIFQ